MEHSTINKTKKRTFECYAATTLKNRKKTKTNKVSPITIGYLTKKPGKWTEQNLRRLRILFDSGSDATIINKNAVKRLKTTKSQDVKWTTKAGSFTTNKRCAIQFKLPYLHENKEIEWNAYVESTPKDHSKYDLIIGRDLMLAVGIDLAFSKEKIIWDGAECDMKHPQFLTEKRWVSLLEKELMLVHDPLTTDAERIQAIIDAKYSKQNPAEVIEKIEHLSKTERKSLIELLEKYQHLFDGGLGEWKTDPIELELKDPDEKPFHSKPYPVPQAHEKQLKEEVERLVQYGILRKTNRSEWASPMFTISKPDGTLRSLADLRELNKRIRRKPFPLPKINDILQKLEGFQFATALDLNMGYYHIRLSPFSSSLCTIVLPWGKYEYLRLPMGLCNAPDIFQEKMSELMSGLEFARAYIDDLLIITNGTFETHLKQLEQVLTRLAEANLKVNLVKSHFAQHETEYLGYEITRDGIRPKMKKVKAIMQIETPTTRKKLRRFIGMVNFYRDVWPMRAHVLAPLSKLTSNKVPWKWTEEHQQAFEEMKRIIAKETLLTYPNFSKPFTIHTDASDLQLGACISQDGKPIAFYSRKLNPAQTKYTTTEQELLSIVETLKEFRTILLGQQLIIHTDHKNLVYKSLTSDRVLRWRLYIEEYSPDIRYIKGEKNVVADALSRLDKSEDNIEDTKENYFMTCYGLDKEDDHLEVYPLSYKQLDIAQQQDKTIMKVLKMKNTKYELKDFHGGGKSFSLVCYKDKIVVPKLLQRHITDWYHTMLCHPGINRTEETISQHLWWPEMRKTIRQLCEVCPTCQKNKRDNPKFGHLPPKEAEATPWDKMCVDLIGPYKIRRKGQDDLICKCVTMIDPATGWFEIHQFDDKRSITIANIVEQEWFCRYPWPTQVTFDRGSEFMGGDFRTMLKEDYGIKQKPISVRNPQANAIVERIHQVIGNMVRTFELETTEINEDEPWKGILSAVAFAVRSTLHSTLKKTPGQLVFGRDMILNIQHQADWEYIKQRKQNKINENNRRENSRRKPHQYNVGDKVLLRRGTENKYESPYSGPHEILQVNDNGTVRMAVKNVIDTFNIRRIKPYKE